MRRKYSRAGLCAVLCTSLLLCSCHTKTISVQSEPASENITKTQKETKTGSIASAKETQASTKETQVSTKETDKETTSSAETTTAVEPTTAEVTTKEEPVTSTKAAQVTESTKASDPYEYDTTLDKKSPVLVNLNRDIYIEKGHAFIPGNYISYIDDYDRNPTLSYTGSVDINTTGTYPITYKITDRAGNTITANSKVTVYVKSSSSGGSDTPYVPPRTLYSDAVAKYGSDHASVGIDVSRWQGDIDFNAVKDAGCEFVIMRMCTWVDDEIGKDYKFDVNFKNAKAAGLKVGVYIYTESKTVEEARANAKWILKTLNGAKLDFPITFDWEDWANLQDYHLTIKELNDMFEAFSEEIEAGGYDSMLYASRYYRQLLWENRKKRAEWIAVYSDSPNYDGDYILWQFCDNGKIDGINEAVDLDVWYH